MGFNKELFRELFTDEVAAGFMRSRETDAESCVSVISSMCQELMGLDCVDSHAELKKDLVNGILNQCCRMLRVPRIYRCLSEVLGREPVVTEVMDIGDFLEEFAGCCDDTLLGGCEITFGGAEKGNIRANRDHLTAAMLIYVRDSIADGAKRISVTGYIEDGKIMAEIAVVERYAERNAVYDAPPEAFSVNDREITETILASIGGKCQYSEGKLVIALDISKDEVMRSQQTISVESWFNVYNIMLSDLGNLYLI